MQKEQNTKSKKPPILWILVAAVCVIGAVLAIVLIKPGTPNASVKTPDTPVEVQAGGVMTIPLSGVSEQASFYPLTVDGAEMELLAIQASDGSIRTAFNTFQSCYTSGNGRYEAEGTELVCQNCGFHFGADQVGIETGGGCNPWPITDANREIVGDEIQIPYDFLQESKAIFANWSRK